MGPIPPDFAKALEGGGVPGNTFSVRYNVDDGILVDTRWC